MSMPIEDGPALGDYKNLTENGEMDYYDGKDWVHVENPLLAALRAHRYQDDPQDSVCSCGVTPDNPPDDDYEWWITHLKANI